MCGVQVEPLGDVDVDVDDHIDDDDVDVDDHVDDLDVDDHVDDAQGGLSAAGETWSRCTRGMQSCRWLSALSLCEIQKKQRISAANFNLQAAYLKEEYTLDLTINKLAVPYVAIMDGITMGGGCGISVNGRYFKKRNLDKI